MSVPQTQTTTQARNRRLSLLRSSIKMLPVITKRSQDLENKQYRAKQQLLNNEENCTEHTINSECFIGEEDSSQSDGVLNQFHQKYTLLDKIGEGCNATVHRCIYKPSQKIYAVKKIRFQQEHVLILKRDFITLKQLSHPSICRYKALYFQPQTRMAFLVMEHILLPSLNDLVIKNEEELRNIVRGLLSAISYLHSRNICHRDIKPENILYDRDEKQVKLIDFGISKKTFLRGQRRDMLTIIGTHLYMAPEMFNGGGYDERIDLWAIGITIFKLVTGSTPFESEYFSSMVKAIQKGEVHFDSPAWKKYSPNLIKFVSCLLKKVDQRLTISEAERHLWLQENSPRLNRLRRRSSLSMNISEQFHQEIMKNINSLAKEEGSVKQDTRLFKSIKLLNSNHYKLEESDDEEDVVTPKSFSESSSIYPSPVSFSEFGMGAFDARFLRNSSG